MSTPLIPRETLFGNPERTSPRLSPDARRLAWLAPEEGTLNVWVRSIGEQDDRAVTHDRSTGIRLFFWAQDADRLLYLQDRDGDENWHLYDIDLKTGAERDLTPFDNTTVGDVITDPNFPDQVFVALNQRDPQLFDLHRVDLRSGKIELEAANPGAYVGWLVDNQFRLRGAQAATPDGGFELLVSKSPGGAMEPLLQWGPEDNGGAHGFVPGDEALYIEDSLAGDTTELYELHLASGERKSLARHDQVDVGPVLQHPTERRVQAVGFALHRLEWKLLDPSLEADFAALAQTADGEINVVSRDRDDRHWLVAFTGDADPVRYYAWDREKQEAMYLFSDRPALQGLPLAAMQPVSIAARDGLGLVAYLTVPVDVEAKDLPLVLNVHGGPWARDEWGYDPEAQWLANRGYAVLHVNFRGSTGFGKRFLNAGNREWGAKMHDDLLDAVAWAVSQGVADPQRVAIYGGSYGGYAALVGAAFTPDVFCCAVDIVGPSNICTLIESIPPYWAPLMHQFRVRVGDIETEREFLESRSPLFRAEEIRVPLLIAQGANDPRVKQAESEQIVSALRSNGKEVDYLLFGDEGHGFSRPENRMAFYAEAEQFLARYLGGRAEPPSSAEAARLAALRK
ncbi:MAG: prolyl oligopeptidase family serine peptidase [Acidobacteria bacterium]|nr:prolyl oligopeptidase family serine peptidase [Acidobacteriota bacterium]